MITRDVLEQFFDDTRGLRDRGEAKFDIDQVCRWSFFFVDLSTEKLEPVASYLDSVGYEVVGFLEPDADDESQVYFLRADRIEHHTVDSLLARNDQLYEIAARFGVQDYDGMDAGAVDGP
jgi:hypothetical protein